MKAVRVRTLELAWRCPTWPCIIRPRCRRSMSRCRKRFTNRLTLPQLPGKFDNLKKIILTYFHFETTFLKSPITNDNCCLINNFLESLFFSICIWIFCSNFDFDVTCKCLKENMVSKLNKNRLLEILLALKITFLLFANLFGFLS